MSGLNKYMFRKKIQYKVKGNIIIPKSFKEKREINYSLIKSWCLIFFAFVFLIILSEVIK